LQESVIILRDLSREKEEKLLENATKQGAHIMKRLEEFKEEFED
jgi:4-aminobutyrate aminotransferase-like enzyme